MNSRCGVSDACIIKQQSAWDIEVAVESEGKYSAAEPETHQGCTTACMGISISTMVRSAKQNI